MSIIKIINLKYLKYELLFLAVFLLLFCVFIPGAHAGGDPGVPSWVDTDDGDNFEIWESSDLTWDTGTLICSAALTDDNGQTIPCTEVSGILPDTTYRVQVVLSASVNEIKLKAAGDYIEHRNVKGGWAGTTPVLGAWDFVDYEGDNNSTVVIANPVFIGNHVRIEATVAFSGEIKLKNAPRREGFMYLITTDSDPATDSTSYLYVNDNNDTEEDSCKITITAGSVSPDAPVFYNTGGAEQLSFNNAKQYTTTPRFRTSATHTESFDRFQIEMNTQADFGGTAYTQTFSGTYTSGVQNNLLCDTLSPSLPTTDGVTYYVRARASADAGSEYGDWSSGTYFFTYNDTNEDIMWFQTTDEQFDTGTLDGAETENDQVKIGASSSWLSGWDQRIQLTIDSAGSKVDADLSDFPILVYLSGASGIGGVDVSAVFDELTSDANSKKIAVTKSDGETELYVEIEKWDDDNEQAWLWVKVAGTDSISSSADTDLYLYYDVDHADNTTYVGDNGSRTEVWDDGGSDYYEGVWHLDEEVADEGTSGIHDDSTGVNDGSQEGNEGVPGKFSGGQDFDGDDDYVDIGTPASLEIYSDLTLSAWISHPAAMSGHAEWVLAKDFSSGNRGYGMGVNPSGQFYLEVSGAAKINTGAIAETAGWHHIAVTYDGTTWRGYLGGVEVGTSETAVPGANSDANWYIGGREYSGFPDRYEGLIDEVRISSTARDPEWIEASFHSGNDSLVTYGSEEVVAGAGSGTIISPTIDYDFFPSGGWNELQFSDNEDNGDIKYDVQYWDGDDGWDQRIPLTIDSAGSKVDADLSDFPILVYLSTDSGIGGVDVSAVFDELDAGSDQGSYPNRKKIKVTNSVGTELYVEIEKWDDDSDAGNEQAWLWVKVAGTDSISSSADTDLYLYYDVDDADNTTYVGDSGSRTEVWNDGYYGVYHFNDGSGTNVKDSTSKSNDGTHAVGDNWITNGKMAGAYDFDGNDDRVTLSGLDTSGFSELSVEVWFNADAWDSYDPIVMRLDDTNWDKGWGLGPGDSSDELTFWVDDYNVEAVTAISDTTSFHLLVGTFDGSDQKVYVDGDWKHTQAETWDEHATTGDTIIGSNAPVGGSYADGVIDEVRISSTARDPEWIEASYYSGDDNLITFDSEEASGSWADTPIVDQDTSPVDLSSLDEVTYNKIRIKATLTDSGGTPYLQDWAVTYGVTATGATKSNWRESY